MSLDEVAFLGSATDGVSCETQSNLNTILRFLRGENDWLAFVDTNHNVKNCRYQVIGGSGQVPASIGAFIFDRFLIAMAQGVPSKIIRVSDFASDNVALRLFSWKVINAVIDVNSRDVGNVAVTVVTLAMARIRSFAVNAVKAEWHSRARFAWVSLLWFTSFHTPASTMLANMRNIVMDKVAVMFLVTRDDVPQSRRVTSEPNEHYHGLLRQIQIHSLRVGALGQQGQP